MTDMEHMKYIDTVADNDCHHLRMKEKTYQGSWKKGGGRSAWFMLRRKIDRLLVMMGRPPVPDGFQIEYKDCVFNVLSGEDRQYIYRCFNAEDIFAKIEEEPGGEDGTVLAEIRDLRRYLLLVEAEMVSRDVVAGKPVKMVLTEMQDENIRYLAELNEPGTPEDGGHHEREQTPDERYIKKPWVIPMEFFVRVDRPVSEGAFNDVYETRGIYKILSPSITKAEYAALKMLAGLRENRTLPTAIMRRLADNIVKMYKDTFMFDHTYVLDISKVPADERDRWPVVPREQNNHEMMGRENWQKTFYKWHETESKWILAKEWKMWEKQT